MWTSQWTCSHDLPEGHRPILYRALASLSSALVLGRFMHIVWVLSCDAHEVELILAVFTWRSLLTAIGIGMHRGLGLQTSLSAAWMKHKRRPLMLRLCCLGLQGVVGDGAINKIVLSLSLIHI